METLLVKTTRKKRVWATTPAATKALARGAKRLAKKFANQLSEPAVAKCVGRLKMLMALERACKLRQGDVLVELLDGHGVRAIDIARITGRRPNDLSQQYNTAKLFPPKLREPDVPYNTYFMAMRMIRKFDTLSLAPAAVLGEIRRIGYSQHRDVTRHFAQLARAAEMRRALPVPQTVNAGNINSVYHARFQDVLHRVPDRAAKIIHCDPPYVYRSTKHGGYSSTSSRSQQCDNATGEAGLSLVIDLLRDWQPKLTVGGVLLLWQASGTLHEKIVEAVDRYDWELAGPIVWDKGREQPGDFAAPYSRQTEMLWMLSRPGDALLNHDGSSRSDILRFPPVSFPGLADRQDHCFEKPQEMSEFLIQKHSHPDELVLDLCGCTASTTLAAIETGRQWIYVESNSQNFEIGAARIAQRLNGRTARAS